MVVFYLEALRKNQSQFFTKVARPISKTLHYHWTWTIFVSIFLKKFAIFRFYSIYFELLKDPLLKSFVNRVPTAVDVDVEKIVNGPECFTPDSKMIMGESAEVKFIKHCLSSLFKHQSLTFKLDRWLLYSRWIKREFDIASWRRWKIHGRTNSVRRDRHSTLAS